MFNQSKAFAIGLLAAVLVAGIAIGAAGSHWATEHRGPKMRPPPRGGFVERMARDLRLTTAQRDSVSAIFRRYDPQSRAVFARVEPQLDSLRRLLHAEIRAQLTVQQQATYDSLMERVRARMARRDSALQRGERHDDD